MAILLTGGTGKTSVRIARLLQEAQIPFLLASRRGPAAAPPGLPATKFDWLDASTFAAPFQHPFPANAPISTVYLVGPVVVDAATPMTSFIDYAIQQHGVKRFVFLAGTTAELGRGGPGIVWQHLVHSGLEYCVLRPTWFMENLSEEEEHRLTIKDQSKIYTACGHGKMPFVSADDIAAVAFRALTDEKPHNTEHTILGPELLSYDEVAAKLSTCLGREVVHVKLTEDERFQGMVSCGLPDWYARFLAGIEAACAGGLEDRMNDVVEKVTGRPPKDFDTFARENRTVWL